MSGEGRELLALRDLFCFKMVPLGEEKRWDVRRWEEERAQVRDVWKKPCWENSITVETSASVWTSRGEGEKKCGWLLIRLAEDRKMAENPITCAACPPGASCTWWCFLSDGFLERERERHTHTHSL